MPFAGRARRAMGAVVLACALAADAASLGAQTTSATVLGSVKDSQGGVVAGAEVTLTSRTQGYSLGTTTDAEGRFVLPIVRPDTYTLRVARQGFKSAERTNVVVSPDDRFFTGVLTLDVGAVVESVTVTDRVSELQATSGERSFTLEGETIRSIANNGRSPFGFATLVPGILQEGTSGSPPEDAAGITVNGQRPNSNNVTIDGVANLDTGNNGANMASTNLDAVSEFKILTNAYQAEYGRAVGGQVQIVTKSGTQSFHGSGYWYGRRSGWNANSWTNKRAAAPPPVGIGHEIQPAEASRNDFGYTIGGPVYVPGVFNEDKKKLFFFWSQEFQRRTDPVAEQPSRVPTLLERQGDFSQSIDSSGNPWPFIKDYQTGLPCGPSNTSGCFAYQGVLGRIPPDRLYQPGLNALGIFPLPNSAGSSGINYTSQSPSDTPRREDLLRIDFQASNRWRFTGRYMRKADTQSLPYGFAWSVGSNNLDTADVTFEAPGWNWMASAVGILDASTTLELSFGSAHNAIDIFTGNPLFKRSAAGLDDMPLLYPGAVQQDYIPDMPAGGGRVGPAGFYATASGPFTNQNTTYDAIANLTKLWGSHSAKFGLYLQTSYKRQSPSASFNSQIIFTDNPANLYDTGFGYANEATGVFNTYTQASKYALPEWRYKNFEWYAQDNWKATPRLTLDYGVRFYYLTPQWDTSLQASNFLPDQFDPNNAATLYVPACLGASPCSGTNRVALDPNTGQTVDGRFIGRLTPGSNAPPTRFNGAFQAGQGTSDSLQSGNAFRVSPRFGFAYDLSGQGRTIVRGGFGSFFDRPQGNVVFDMITNAPGMLQPQLQFGLLQNLTSSGTEPAPTLQMFPTAYGFKPPNVYAWNLGVQQKLWRSVIFDLAYVGSSSKDLVRQTQINAVPYGAKFLPENQDPTLPPSPVPGATALPDDLLRPYPGYAAIRLGEYSAYANYHALQASLSRRFDNGLMFSAFYVWSKALGISDGDFPASFPLVFGRTSASDAEIRRADYSYVAYDRPHNVVVNFVYQTPRAASGALGVLLNEWQISGIYRWTSGRPYPVNFVIPGIGPANLTGSDQPARVVLTGDPGRGWSDDPYRQINTAVFAPPQPGSDGTESARYFLHGPPIDNLDLSLSKSFSFGKGVRLEVRLDAFNALNHTQFTGVNNTAVFASLSDPTITNLPYDASGVLVRNNGFGSISGVAPPRTLQLVTRLTF
jgi:carboxypeptidase family protein/TonB-dependent receptor-like protein